MEICRVFISLWINGRRERIATATGDPTPTITTRPERRRHGMGHVVGDGDVLTA